MRAVRNVFPLFYIYFTWYLLVLILPGIADFSVPGKTKQEIQTKFDATDQEMDEAFDMLKNMPPPRDR